jgi:hypothetical protein
MVWESGPWKCYLWRDAQTLERAMSRKSLSGASERSQWALSRLERTVFTAALSVRKLADSEKLSDECLAYAVPAHRFAATGTKRPTSMNWHHFDEHFDMQTPTPCNLCTRDLCNTLIHSFQFFFAFSEERLLSGFMVSSDRKRTVCLYGFDMCEIVRWLRYVATDGIDLLEQRRTPQGDIRVRRARRWEEAAEEMYRCLGEKPERRRGAR